MIRLFLSLCLLAVTALPSMAFGPRTAVSTGGGVAVSTGGLFHRTAIAVGGTGPVAVSTGGLFRRANIAIAGGGVGSGVAISSGGLFHRTSIAVSGGHTVTPALVGVHQGFVGVHQGSYNAGFSRGFTGVTYGAGYAPIGAPVGYAATGYSMVVPPQPTLIEEQTQTTIRRFAVTQQHVQVDPTPVRLAAPAPVTYTAPVAAPSCGVRFGVGICR